MQKLCNYKTLAIMALMLGACSKNTELSLQPSSQDFVAIELGKAVEEAHGHLATISELRGKGVEVLIPAPDKKLNQEITANWTDTPRNIIKDICLTVGYKYQELGYTAQEIPIVINSYKKPAYEVLEDIALQIQPKAMVKVDTIGEIITLAYPSTAR